MCANGIISLLTVVSPPALVASEQAAAFPVELPGE
jgi:hypothetical protein